MSQGHFATTTMAGARPSSEVTAIALADADNKTTFKLVLSRGVPAEIFTLANPYRVIIDLPDVAFKLPSSTAQKQQGLITA